MNTAISEMVNEAFAINSKTILKYACGICSRCAVREFKGKQQNIKLIGLILVVNVYRVALFAPIINRFF